ncbi:pilus assembly protein TadG-related protein [Rhodoplanes sp. SY1]|uniref:pilus assembly protein TadG-related protein n=1 Tax=Rhodoplanes sp. SY1 TaxID=3166646 RepID=UPI0038B67755
MSTRLSKAWSLLETFRREERGNVAIMFAVALVPLLGLVGAAIDYSRASSFRTKMQAAADSTALAVSKTASGKTNDQLTAEADAYYRAQINSKDATVNEVKTTYTKEPSANVVVTATATIKPAFMGVLGFSPMTLKASSTTTWGNRRLRVALALDNTGSMNDDNKMVELKKALTTANTGLLPQLRAAAASPGDVYVSIIPFSKDVNVGSTNYTANWIDWTDWEAPPANSMPDMSVGPGSACPYPKDWWGNKPMGFTCTASATNGSSEVSTVPASGLICPGIDNGAVTASLNGRYYNGCYNSTQYYCKGKSCSCSGRSQCDCSGNGNNKICQTKSGYYEHAWVVNDHSTWTGCVTDRGAASGPSPATAGDGYDQKSTAPSTSIAASLFPAEQTSYCAGSNGLKAMIGLKDMRTDADYNAMTTFVNNMQPNGSTNQGIGLVWAWHSLVGAGPLTAPTYDSKYDHLNVIILMSDGLNTQNRWDGRGYGGQASSVVDKINDRMRDSSGLGTCKNIKDTTIAGSTVPIVIYTVQVNTGNDPTSTLLQNCASPNVLYKNGVALDGFPTGDKFFQVKTASQIGTVFAQIASTLSQLRVAK